MRVMQSTLTSWGVRGWCHKTSGAFFTQNFLCTLSLVGATNMPVLVHHLGLPGRPCARRHHTIGDHMHRGRGKSGGFFHAEPGLGSPCRHSKVCAATCSGQARAVARAVCAAKKMSAENISESISKRRAPRRSLHPKYWRSAERWLARPTRGAVLELPD